MDPLLRRWVKLHSPVTAWLRKLGPSRTSSERTFEHCVSPSPLGTATAATGVCTHRKSQRDPPFTLKGRSGNMRDASYICKGGRVDAERAAHHCLARTNMRFGTSNENRNWTAQYSWTRVPGLSNERSCSRYTLIS